MSQDWIPAPHLTGLQDQFQYSLEKHAPQKRKSISFALVCKFCGLIYLKNDYTRWAISMGCNARYHPDNRKMREKFSKKI